MQGNLIKLFQEEIIKVCQQMTDSWGVLGEEEKQRIYTLAEHHATNLNENLRYRLDKMLMAERAQGHPYIIATEKGISLKDDNLVLSLSASRKEAPIALYDHQGAFLVILTNKKVTLEEFELQGEFDFIDPGLLEGPEDDGPGEADDADDDLFNEGEEPDDEGPEPGGGVPDDPEPIDG